MTATIFTRRGATVDAIDFYCGFGGSAQGIKAAGADIRAAANHNQLAIECHAANFPDVDHYRADLVDHCCTSNRCAGRHVYAVQTWKQATKAWPLPKWGKYKRQYVYCCPDCKSQVEPAAWPAYTAINWSNLGPTLGERAELGMNQLATATVERIRRALAKFGGSPPFIIPTKSVWGTDRSVTQPFTAQTTQQDKALVSAIIKNNGSLQEAKYRAKSPLNTFGALTTNPTQALATAAVVPQRFNSNPTSAHQNVPTVTTQQSDLTLTSVILPAAGNTYEASGYTRARHIAQQLYTQHTTHAFGFASAPSLVEMRGGGSIQAGQHSITETAHTVTAGGLHHGLVSTPLLLNGQDNESVHTVAEPAFTVRANGGAGRLISPALFAKFNGGPSDTAWHATTEPFNTVTPRDTHGLVLLPWIEEFRADPVAVTKQLATLMSQLRHALASSPELPLDQITQEDLMNTHFRMLEPDPELRRAMAFEDDYILLGNKTQMTTGLGNAVTPPVATWITARCLQTLGALVN